jgi:hypothetical protein
MPQVRPSHGMPTRSPAQPVDARPDRIDPADDLVPRDDWQLRVRQVAVDDVQVRPGDAAGSDLHPNLARTGLPIGELGPLKSSPNLLQHHRMHRVPRLLGSPASCMWPGIRWPRGRRSIPMRSRLRRHDICAGAHRNGKQRWPGPFGTGPTKPYGIVATICCISSAVKARRVVERILPIDPTLYIQVAMASSDPSAMVTMSN